jgi:hypothetical protein
LSDFPHSCKDWKPVAREEIAFSFQIVQLQNQDSAMTPNANHSMALTLKMQECKINLKGCRHFRTGIHVSQQSKLDLRRSSVVMLSQADDIGNQRQ